MIGKICKYCSILFVACFLGLLIARDPGYVLFYYQGLSLETSLWCAILLLAIGWFIVRSLFKAWQNLRQISVKLRNYFHDKQESLAFNLNIKAFMAYAVNDYPVAKTNWEQSLQYLEAKTPWINFLLASLSLDEKNYVLANSQLQKFRGIVSLKNENIVMPYQLQSSFIACLREHMAIDLLHSQIVKSLAIDFGTDASNLYLESLPKRKWPINSQTVRDDIIQYFAYWIGTLDIESLPRVYQNLPNYVSKEPAIHIAYFEAALKLGLDKQVETDLKQTLVNNWSEELMTLYGQFEFEAKQQLNWAEKLIKAHAESVTLYLTIAKLQMRLNDLDGSHKTLQKALIFSNDARIYLELGNLYENLGQLEESRKYYKDAAIKSLQGAKLVSTLPDLIRD